MKRYIYTLCFMAVVTLGLQSCLNSSDSTEFTAYDDTAIAAFSLTTANRYLHTTTAAGNDSIYKTTLSLSSYLFTIDQYQRKIYNTDSLPAGCDLQHVLANITVSSHSGLVSIKSITSDSLQTYSSSDSIDFSVPRVLRVFNNTLEVYRDYEVQVNMKEAAGGAMSWERMDGTAGLPAAIGQAVSITTAEDSDGFRLSLDGGATWSQESLGEGEDKALLPQANASYVSFPLAYGKEMAYHLLAGAVNEGDSLCTVWRKLTDQGVGHWVNMPVEKNNYYGLPAANHISLFYCNKSILALTDTGTVYESVDQGITWKGSAFSLPEGVEKQGLRAAVDEEGYIWLISLASEEVWRGRYEQ